MRYGTLVPHFGEYASRDAIVRLAATAEKLGYRSLWVRDHLIWSPHGMEGTNKTFLDPFLTMAAMAAVTTECTLGTAVVIPIRWPLKLAQEFSSLSFLNEGRVIAGIGLGASPAEFAGAGLDVEKKDEIFQETVAICRQAWSQGWVEFSGVVFDIEHVDLLPTPVEPIPIVYGGNTPAAVRRAVGFTDGWCPGRLPMATLKKRLDYLAEQNVDEKPMLTQIQPLVVIADSYEEAAALVPIKEVATSSQGAKFWVKPESGSFDTVQDLAGLVLCGTAQDIAEQVQEFEQLGFDDFIFDFRLQFDRYEYALEKVGGEVFPLLGYDPSELNQTTQKSKELS
jgi:alkanesulfonate monooxygenase SsuD/methylene tetrahydromethanopterin reductase-like flavin-dependent oxidoreductase (luciferase family)